MKQKRRRRRERRSEEEVREEKREIRTLTSLHTHTNLIEPGPRF